MKKFYPWLEVGVDMEEKKLRICIDLDGTICTIKKPDETYADVSVFILYLLRNLSFCINKSNL